MSTGSLAQQIVWEYPLTCQTHIEAVENQSRAHRQLNAGVLEEGQWSCSEEGTPQGGSASPLLANIYLHYVFDLWVQHPSWLCSNCRALALRIKPFTFDQFSQS
jgi:hypothetical protein